MQGNESESSFSDELFESLNVGKERMVREDRTMVIQLQSLLKHVDEEKHESFLNELIDEYSDPNSSFQLSDLIKQLDDDLDRKPAAQVVGIFVRIHNVR